MGAKPKIKEGKRYRINHGAGKGQVGLCIKTWETGFGHRYLQVQTDSKVFSLRVEDVERVKN